MQLSCQRGIIFALLAGGALLVTGGMAISTELDEESCRLLKDEQAKLVQAGVKDSMANGPEWAKTNLPAARLKEIQRLIEVDEQIAFRCPQPKPVESTNSEGEKASEKNGPKAPVPKPKPKPEPKEAKPARAKVNDAYVPPPKVNDAYVPPPQSKPLPQTGAASTGQGSR